MKKKTCNENESGPPAFKETQVKCPFCMKVKSTEMLSA